MASTREMASDASGRVWEPAVYGLTPAQALRAQDVALADYRFDTMLRDHPARTTSVRKTSSQPLTALVAVAFSDPPPLDAWPRAPQHDEAGRYDGQAVGALDQCAIGHHSDHITGVHWLVDLSEESVRAVSPVWDGIDCGLD